MSALGEKILNGTTIRHRLAALSSLFQYLCDKNAVNHNPVNGVKRPRTESEEGKTPAIADHQARKLLVAPAEKSLKGIRDRAILATLLYHALRREELCKLAMRDFMHERGGVRHLRVSGTGEKTRYVPLHGMAKDLIEDYLKKSPDEAAMRPAPFFVRSAIAEAAVGKERSLQTAYTSWCESIQRSSDSRSGLIPCVQRPPRTRSITMRTSQRFRSGSATPTSRRPEFTITERQGQKISPTF